MRIALDRLNLKRWVEASEGAATPAAFWSVFGPRPAPAPTDAERAAGIATADTSQQEMK